MAIEIKHGDENFLSFSLKIFRRHMGWSAHADEMYVDKTYTNKFSFAININEGSREAAVADKEVLEPNVYRSNAIIAFQHDSHYRNYNFEVTGNFSSQTSFNVKLEKITNTIFSAQQFLVYAPTLKSELHNTVLNVKISFNKNDTQGDKELLANDMKKLLQSERHSDFRLKVDDRQFNVHKNVLSCRSNVLAKMIESDMLEKKLGEIKLHDTDPSAVQLLLDYIYTDKCEMSTAPHELFKLAHFLELHQLQLQCKKYLIDNISNDNIVETLLLTNNYEQYDLFDLKTCAMMFVDENESTLIKNVDFQHYLISTICIDNLAFVLRLANKYQIKETLDRAMEFLRLNYKASLRNEECREFLSVHGDLVLQILEYSCDKYTTASLSSSASKQTDMDVEIDKL